MTLSERIVDASMGLPRLRQLAKTYDQRSKINNSRSASGHPADALREGGTARAHHRSLPEDDEEALPIPHHRRPEVGYGNGVTVVRTVSISEGYGSEHISIVFLLQIRRTTAAIRRTSLARYCKRVSPRSLP